MGGAPAGDVASQIAVETILEQLNLPTRATASRPSLDDQGYLPQTSRLAEAVRQSNQFIYNQARKDARQAGMGTTVVAVCIEQHIISVAHVGDSRAYLWHNNDLVPG